MGEIKKEKLVIVGAGFGGIKAGLLLSNDPNFDVTIINDKDTFRYYPRLYHTATGGNSKETSILLTSIFENHDINIVIDKVSKIDRKNKVFKTESGKDINYDKAIIALGVVTNYFGIEGLQEFSYGIKSKEEAEKLKSHLHQTLITDGSPDRHYVVIGAGPTGIELSGQLAFYMKDLLKNHGMKNKKVKIDLIEAAPRVLPTLSEQTSIAVTNRLKSIGVNVMTGKAVQSENIDTLTVSGKPIKSHTVVWTAGVTNSPFFKENGFKLNEKGKVVVDRYLRAEENIFVIGDNAATQYSGMAQTALVNAVLVSNNLIRSKNGKSMLMDKPKRPISVIPAGKKWAAVIWGRLELFGWLGWILREAADYIAFNDLQPWWKAGAQWTTEFLKDDQCPICDHK